MASSVQLTGEYGEQGIFAGCPALIGGNGVEEVIEYNLPPEELKEFKACEMIPVYLSVLTCVAY